MRFLPTESGIVHRPYSGWLDSVFEQYVWVVWRNRICRRFISDRLSCALTIDFTPRRLS